jgi:HlyD family secretion protein
VAPSRILTTAALCAVLAAACTGDDEPELGFAEVDRAEVVETVAAAAVLEPRERVTVSAQVGGEVAELLVGDGDVVEAGDELVRLSSESLDQQVEQAETAVETAEELGSVDAAAAPDLGAVIAPFQRQFDTVLPELVGALDEQVAAAESALETAILQVVEASEAADELRAEVVVALEERDVLGVVDELDLDELPEGPRSGAALDALTEAQEATERARGQLAVTRSEFRQASEELAAAERQLEEQAGASQQAQAAAVAGQVEQAERALEITRARLDDLVIEAPIDGVVELVRGGGGGGVPDLGDLGGLDGEAGDVEGLLGDGGPGELLGDGGDDGPIRVGSTVGVGQPLLTIFDLSGFAAGAEVDEIDVVDVEPGQPVEIVLDAFPGETLVGEVERIGLAPRSDAAGGALYPVGIEVIEVPDGVEPRVGLTAATEIEVARVDGELVVPTSALLRRGEGEVVHVVRDGVAVEEPVTLLAIGDEDAAVDGDLEPGETVITTGVELVSDGDEVEG